MDTLHEVKLADAWVLINLQSSMRHRYNALPREPFTYGERFGLYAENMRFQLLVVLDACGLLQERFLLLVWRIQ